MHGKTDIAAGHFTVVCASPNVTSVSRVMTRFVTRHMSAKNIEIETFDFLEFPPIWVGKGMEERLPEAWITLRNSVARSRALIVCGPVYYYDAGSPYNVLMEALGEGIAWKPALLLTAAGSARSHLAVGSLMQNLIFERNTIVFPDTVLATEGDLAGQEISNEEIRQRLTTVLDRFVAFAEATCRFLEPHEVG